MVVGGASVCEQLRIVDGSTPVVVTWAHTLVSRQWRHGGAPGHGGWGRLTDVNRPATFYLIHLIKMWFVGGAISRSPFLLLGFQKSRPCSNTLVHHKLFYNVSTNDDSKNFSLFTVPGSERIRTLFGLGHARDGARGALPAHDALVQAGAQLICILAVWSPRLCRVEHGKR